MLLGGIWSVLDSAAEWTGKVTFRHDNFENAIIRQGLSFRVAVEFKIGPGAEFRVSEPARQDLTPPKEVSEWDIRSDGRIENFLEQGHRCLPFLHRPNALPFSCKGGYVIVDSSTAGAARRPPFIC
jgi:hypothetical protein